MPANEQKMGLPRYRCLLLGYIGLLFTFAGTRNYPYASALALIFIAPSVLYLVIASRYLSQESAALGGL